MAQSPGFAGVTPRDEKATAIGVRRHSPAL
jgi:hypothetical protein